MPSSTPDACVVDVVSQQSSHPPLHDGLGRVGGHGDIELGSAAGAQRRSSADRQLQAASAQQQPTLITTPVQQQQQPRQLARSGSAKQRRNSEKELSGSHDDESQQMLCRICLFETRDADEEARGIVVADMGEKDVLVPLRCGCRGELSLVHTCCAARWFATRRSNLCEICGGEAFLVPSEEVMTLLREGSWRQRHSLCMIAFRMPLAAHAQRPWRVGARRSTAAGGDCQPEARGPLRWARVHDLNGLSVSPDPAAQLEGTTAAAAAGGGGGNGGGGAQLQTQQQQQQQQNVSTAVVVAIPMTPNGLLAASAVGGGGQAVGNGRRSISATEQQPQQPAAGGGGGLPPIASPPPPLLPVAGHAATGLLPRTCSVGGPPAAVGPPVDAGADADADEYTLISLHAFALEEAEMAARRRAISQQRGRRRDFILRGGTTRQLICSCLYIDLPALFLIGIIIAIAVLLLRV